MTGIFLPLLFAMNLLGLSSVQLSAIAKSVAEQAIVEFKAKDLKSDEVEISIVSIDSNRSNWVQGSFNGDVNMYPASVVKLLYAAYLANLLDSKRVKFTPELDRATKDMLVESSNDGTALVVDTITGTTGGPELSPGDLKKWMEKRQAVNKWLAKLGYENQNACQKPWNEGPYGRERQGYGVNLKHRNSLSPNACSRMMAEIVLAKVASKARCDWLLGYMKRSIGENGNDIGGQSKGFLGESLPNGTEFWSKAGLAYEVRHDVCYFKTPDKREFVLAVYTDRHGSNQNLLPYIGRQIWTRLNENRGVSDK